MKVCALGFNIYLGMFAAVALVCGCKSDHTATKESDQVGALRVHIETNPSPDGSQTVSVMREAPVAITVATSPILTESDVVAARVLDAPAGAGYAVEVKFGDTGGLILQQYSAANQGRHFVIFGQWGKKGTDGRWLGAPLITRRIDDGLLSFTPDMSRDDAYRLVLGLNNVAKKIAKGAMK